MENWTPAAEGRGFELTPMLEPLAPFRDRLLVLSGLNSKPPAGLTGANIGDHARAVDALPDRRAAEADEQRRDPGRRLDGSDGREAGWASRRSWRRSSSRSRGATSPARATSATAAPTPTRSPGAAPTTPLPMENNPRVVFERLFGDSGSTDPSARLARIAARTAASSTRSPTRSTGLQPAHRRRAIARS